ncbi:MAG: retroviral-like aspartic protease family protein [Bacteroidales bacterium]|nr:retroviral-like aspartic protease family protein [Bacteroidales bacterium]
MERTFQKISKLNFTLLLSLFVVFASCGSKNNESYSDEYSEDYIEDEYYEEETIIEDYVEIAYQEKGGVKLLPVKINGLGFFMIFDTGCSTNLISRLEFISLVKNGLITEDDILEPIKSSIADGSVVEMPVVRLKKVIVGDKILFEDVVACVADNVAADLLLGNEILNRVKSYEVDNDKQVIKFKLW